MAVMEEDYLKLQKELEEAQKENTLLQEEVKHLRRLLFGQSSEKRRSTSPPADGSLQLDLLADPEEPTQAEIKEELTPPKKERKSTPRKPIPKELPRETEVLDLPKEEKHCSCCGSEMQQIGEEVTEKIEIIPARLFVRRIKRPRYACNHCKEGGAMRQRPLPHQAIERADAGPTLLASILTAKYVDHLPLCRQEKIFARHGLDLPRGKMSDWMMKLADLMKPVVDAMARRVLTSRVLGMDETTLEVLEPGAKKTRKAWLWTIRGDSRAPYLIFQFHPSRGQQLPRELLRDFSGWLQCDGYPAYSALDDDPKYTFSRAGCMSHARRKFVDAKKIGDRRAEAALDLFGALYKIEEKLVDKPPPERLALRQEESIPILNRLHDWMHCDEAIKVLPRSKLGDAIGYLERDWEALTAFTRDGDLPIDNNAVERAIRPVALGRKNWLFAGSERGGHAAATFYSLIESAKRAGLNVWEYLTDLIIRLPGHLVNRLEELLPDRWQKP